MGSPSIAVGYDIVLLIALAYGSTLLAPSTARLVLKRRFDTVLSVRAANKVTLVLENGGPETIRAILRDEPPPLFDATRKEFRVELHSQRPVELTYHVTPFERGSEVD